MKKTLLISPYAPPSGSGSGLMIYNIFSLLPKDKLVILTDQENKDQTVQKYKLPVPYFYYGSQVLSLSFSTVDETWLQKVKRILKNIAIAKFLGELFVLTAIPAKIVRLGKKIIQEHKIEQILGYSDIGLSLLGSYWLSVSTNLPLKLHFYDLYIGNKQPFLFRLLSYWLEPRLFKRADTISVMCEGLKEHYEKKYGREIHLIYNAASSEGFPSVMPPLKERLGHFKIIFLGNIYWAQLGAVRNLIRAVESIEKLPVRLSIYAPHPEAYLNSIGIKATPRIELTRCKPEEVSDVMSNADALFVGLSFGTPYPDLINTSSPGKLSDYLYSGRPIIVHAPAESYISKYAEKDGWALVVNKDNVELLKKAIELLAQDESLKKNLPACAYAWAIGHLSAKTNATKMQELLS